MNWTLFWLAITAIVSSAVVSVGGQIITTEYFHKRGDDRTGACRHESVVVLCMTLATYFLCVLVVAVAIVAVTFVRVPKDNKSAEQPTPAPVLPTSILEK